MISLKVSLPRNKMQENWERLKIPPAWKPDKWVCHHSGNRQSSMMDNYYYHSWERKSTATSRNVDTPVSSKRISTAKLRRGKYLPNKTIRASFLCVLEIENLSLKSAEYRRSARQSKVKRLNATLSPKSYKSLFSYTSHRTMTPIHIPKMSKQSLKRWLDARDAYLGHNFPYIQDRKKRFRRLRRKLPSTTKTNQMIDYECATSILSMDSDRFSVPELTTTGKQRRYSRKDNRRKPISQSETNLRRKTGCFEGIKSLAQSSVRSLSRLSPRKSPKLKRIEIVHDHFDDKCVGTEISERNPVRSNVERKDQTTQANIPRPQIKLHHEFDTSMVVGEKKQRIRSVRRHVEYRDKATETDFILNIDSVIIEKDKRTRAEEEEEHQVKNHAYDKGTRRDIDQEKGDSDQNQSNIEQDEHQSPTMSTSADQKKKKTNNKMELEQPPAGQHLNNRIVPLTNLDRTTRTHQDKETGSRTTILTSTESNASTHEQLLRYAKENEFELITISYIINYHLLFHFFKTILCVLLHSVNRDCLSSSSSSSPSNSMNLCTYIQQTYA